MVPFQLLADTPARIVCQVFILMGIRECAEEGAGSGLERRDETLPASFIRFTNVTRVRTYVPVSVRIFLPRSASFYWTMACVDD